MDVNQLFSSTTYEDAAMLYRAYYLAVTAHKGQKRADGSDYIEHPLAVASFFKVGNIIQDDYEEMVNLLCSGILHDTGEDSDIWGDRWHPEFLTFMYRTISRWFNPIIARNVVNVTRLSHDKSEKSRKSCNDDYLYRLKWADAEPRLLKLADITHNSESAIFLGKEHELYGKTMQNVDMYMDVLGPARSRKEEFFYERIHAARVL